jgi:hypothetical protein
MPEQMDFTQGETSDTPRPGRKRAAAPKTQPQEGSAAATPAPPANAEAGDFGDVSHLTKKGLRVVPVVTGAVLDESGNFLFYIDGHEDARSGVQAQVNYLLGSGPAREEHLAPARARVRLLLEKLSRPR